MITDKKYIVYKHTSPSGKVYIGITCQNPEQRWRSGKGYKNNQPFYYAIQKYGWNNILHEIIACNLSHNEAQDMERRLIKEYHSTDKNFGYNICFGGEDGWVGVHHTEIAKKKISLAKKGKPSSRKGVSLSDETKKKLSDSHKGKYRGNPVKPKIKKRQFDKDGKIVFSEEHRKHISEATKGICRSEETRKRMSEAQVKTKKPVRCIDTGEEFESMTAAMKKFNIDKNLISRVCSGRNKTAKGLRFEYVRKYTR